MTFHEIIESFIADQDVWPNSKKTYRQWLKPFQLYVTDKQINVMHIRRKEIIDYKDYLRLKYSEKTINSYLGIVRMLYQWMERNQLAENTAAGVRLIRLNKPYRKAAISLTQYGDLIASCPDTITGKRLLCMIMLMANNALRSVELTTLTRSDITPYQIRIQGKGHHSKDAVMTITKDLYDLLIEVAGSSSYVFHTYNNKPLRAKYISHLINSHMKAIGIKSQSITTHSLRHMAAVRAMMKTRDIYEVKKLMRHTTTKTTEIYLNAISHDDTQLNSIIHGIADDLKEAVKQSQKRKKQTESDTNDGISI